MSKKRKAKPSKSNAIGRLRRLVKGLIVEWSDDDPLTPTGQPIDGTFSHKNPVMNINAKDTFRGMGNWLVNEQPFMWSIEVTGIFDTKPKLTHETRFVDAFCTIADVNDFVCDQIKEIRRYGNDDLYKTIKFRLECVGLTQ